jgi:hypothetical protein
MNTNTNSINKPIIEPIIEPINNSYNLSENYLQLISNIINKQLLNFDNNCLWGRINNEEIMRD